MLTALACAPKGPEALTDGSTTDEPCSADSGADECLPTSGGASGRSITSCGAPTRTGSPASSSLEMAASGSELALAIRLLDEGGDSTFVRFLRLDTAGFE